MQFTRALPEVSRFSASPWETLTRRLAQRDAGLEHLLVNVPLFDLRGTLLGVADLLDRTSGLVIESDGEGHRLEAHHAEDNRREEVFERHNLTVVRVTVSDHARPVDTGARIRAAQRSGMRRDRTYDSWSLAKPTWWWQWSPGRRYD